MRLIRCVWADDNIGCCGSSEFFCRTRWFVCLTLEMRCVQGICASFWVEHELSHADAGRLPVAAQKLGSIVRHKTRIDNVRNLSLRNWAESSQGRQRPGQLIKQIYRADKNIARKLEPVNLTTFQNATARHLTMDRIVIITYKPQTNQPQRHLHFNDGRPSITRQTASTSRCRLARTLWVLLVGGPRV